MSDFIKGLDGFKKTLDRIGSNARQMHGDHKVPFKDLFSAAFMRKHTSVASFDELIRLGGFEGMDFKDIPDGPWDQVVRSRTSFADWEAMREAAVQEWAHKELMRGVK